MAFDFESKIPQLPGRELGMWCAVTGRIVRRNPDKLLKKRYLPRLEIPVDSTAQTLGQSFLATGSLFQHSAFSHRIAFSSSVHILFVYELNSISKRNVVQTVKKISYPG